MKKFIFLLSFIMFNTFALTCDDLRVETTIDVGSQTRFHDVYGLLTITKVNEYKSYRNFSVKLVLNVGTAFNLAATCHLDKISVNYMSSYAYIDLNDNVNDNMKISSNFIKYLHTH